MKLAIDFGTTNTVIATWDQHPQIVTLPGLSTSPDGIQSVVPSLVYVQNGQTGEVVIGQAVRDQALDARQDNRLFRNFKRGMVSRPEPDPRPIDGRLWSDRTAAEVYLRRLLAALPQRDVDQMVLTAPVAAFESYLSWLSGLLGETASDQVYVVDESTAAALGYAVTEPGAPVMVFDFGGGTLDLSLVQLPDSREATGGVLSRLRRGSAVQHTAKVIAKGGRVLGGSDIDQWLLTHVLTQLDLTPADLGSSYTAALTACEYAKIRLSGEESAIVSFEAGGTTRTLNLTRAELEALLTANGFYDALRHVVDKVMHVAHRAGIFREDVKYVLLVGGVSLMPSVQAGLRSYFGESAVRAEKPFTAVAEGALQVAAGYGLDDYLNQSYGLRYLDPVTNQPRYDEIIPMGSRYPSERPVLVELAAAYPAQPAVEFVIGEIGTEAGAMVEVRYEGGQTVFVAEAHSAGEQITPLNASNPARVKLDPAGKPGERRLRAQFSVDERRRLHLKVTDLRTRRDLLTDVILVTLGKTETTGVDPLANLTGTEPALADRTGGQRQLSLRGIATMLNTLPPEAISLDAAEAALRSDNFWARYNAAVALGKRGDRDARNNMQRVLRDGSPPARASVARHLNGFTWYAAEPLLRTALADQDSRVREGAMYALSALGELNAYRLMAETLQTEEDNVREAAAYGLRDCRDPAAVPALQAVLLAQDPEVRVKALEALSNNDTPHALPVVRAALADNHPNVLYAATLSFLELAGAAGLREIADLLQRVAAGARETILRALFHATNYLNMDLRTDPAAGVLFDALEASLQDRLPGTRMAAFWLLAWIRHDRTSALLTQAYHQERNSGVRAHLVRVVVALMSPVGETLLQEALRSDDPQVKAAADRIVELRERSGVILEYDESAAAGTGIARPARSLTTPVGNQGRSD